LELQDWEEEVRLESPEQVSPKQDALTIESWKKESFFSFLEGFDFYFTGFFNHFLKIIFS
jgi:hypothetical protein